MVNVQDADLYFSEVLHNDEWMEADTDMKNRALKTSERHLSKLVPKEFELPSEAIYEQAIHLLRVDESFYKAQLGMKQTSISGISISQDLKNVKIINGVPISEVAITIIQEAGGTVKGNTRVGRYVL